jgi:methionyl-tRNA formyltransferase
VLECSQGGIIVACGNGAVRLDELQLPGRRRAPAREFTQQLDLSGRVLN